MKGNNNNIQRKQHNKWNEHERSNRNELNRVVKLLDIFIVIVERENHCYA